jgi:hypothetical protein
MRDVPKFVLTRLKEKTPVADSHPDADLLTAFAEQSLGGDERARMLEHLAACGDCRDAVALALPETEMVASPVFSAAQVGWLSWPAWRWGALAAGMLVVLSVGVLEYSHRDRQNSVASNGKPKAAAVPSTMSQPSTMNQPMSAEITPSAAETRKKAAAAPASNMSIARKPDFESNGATKSSAGYGGEIGAGRGLSADRVTVFAPVPQSPPAAARQTPNASPQIQQQMRIGAAADAVEVAGKNAPTTTESVASQNEVAQNRMELPPQGRPVSNSTNLDVVKAKDPVTAQGASKAAPQLATPGPLQTAPALMLRASPRWTVSSSGGLQRSFDGGNTWVDVNPAVNLGSADTHVAMESAPKAPAATFGNAKQSMAKQNQKAEPALNPAPVFRAVAASGLEVWAGGSGSALYHSSDGGNRWTRVAPASATAALTGDIIGIQFSDTQHGQVSTSTAELWSTSDAGETWRRQQ